MERFIALKKQLTNEYNLEIPELKTSKIRYLDIGNNYFKILNPRNKKNIINILDAYINNL